jgi:hypothetical protein
MFTATRRTFRPEINNTAASAAFSRIFLNAKRRRFDQVRLGCVFERPIVHEGARSRIDQLLLGLTDYASLVEAVGLYEHQSRRRGVLDRKDYFDVQCVLHG